MIELFGESDKCAGAAPRYRKDLEPVFEYLEAKIGKADVSRLTQPDINDAMEKNNHRVCFANYIPTAVSILSKMAIRKWCRLDNPALDVQRLGFIGTGKSRI